VSKKSEILKLLQESAKLDRAGIRIGWCDDVKKDQPIQQDTEGEETDVGTAVQ